MGKQTAHDLGLLTETAVMLVRNLWYGWPQASNQCCLNKASRYVLMHVKVQIEPRRYSCDLKDRQYSMTLAMRCVAQRKDGRQPDL